MWAIKILSGSQAGQIYILKSGKNLIGRSANCSIRIDSVGVSKEHAEIQVTPQGQVILKDLQSRNGSFVDGIKIQEKNLRLGNKISFFDVLVDFIPAPAQISTPALQMPIPMAMPMSIPLQMTSQNIEFENQNIETHPSSSDSGSFLEKVKKYLDNVAMPGVFKLASVLEFRIVVGLFLGGFALLVTSLSTIPMISLMSDSILVESQRRALTIGKNLANYNQTALLQESENALSTQVADLEDGVKEALIIKQSDGTVLAPSSKSGTVINLPFIEVARKNGKERVEKINSSQIGVAVPIASFDPQSGTVGIKAFAIVIYDMGTLAIDDGKTFNLFVQTLIIALLLGSIIYYLLYRLIEYPITDLNKQIDQALKEKSDNTSIDIDYPALQDLIANINTVLSRSIHGGGDENKNFQSNRQIEAENVCYLVGYAAIALTKDLSIITVNSAFEQLLSIDNSKLRNQPMIMIPDQALQKNIIDLTSRSSSDPAAISTGELEFGGDNYSLNAQAVLGSSGPEYYIITIVPFAKAQGGAA
jgi:pSer/pThr/pTyr-binding forkhead associated (FHA) protein